MKLIVTIPFSWDGVSYAKGHAITDAKVVKALRASNLRNHFVVANDTQAK